MSAITNQQSATTANPSDWPGSPLSTLHHGMGQVRPILIEQYHDKDSYVIRLEIPGVDPARDLAVAVKTGTLTVTADRKDDGPVGCDSEFHYGHFARHVALPVGANVQDVSASSRNGILTVRIGMEPEHQHDSRPIDVAVEP